MNEIVRKHTKILWDYLRMGQELQQVGCVLVLGSHDLRVAERAVEIYKNGYSDLLIVTGGLGRLTKALWKMKEADKFAEVLAHSGVPSEKIIKEYEATNTLENVVNTKKLLAERSLQVDSIIVLTKPYGERRSYATIKKYWPEIELIAASPELGLDEYLEFYKDFGGLSVDDVISLMVGEVQRIRIYQEGDPKTYTEIPEGVESSYNELVQLGYTKYLIDDEKAYFEGYQKAALQSN